MLDSRCLFLELSTVVGVAALDLSSDASGHDDTLAGILLFKPRSQASQSSLAVKPRSQASQSSLAVASVPCPSSFRININRKKTNPSVVSSSAKGRAPV